jgi:hypothetical protein
MSHVFGSSHLGGEVVEALPAGGAHWTDGQHDEGACWKAESGSGGESFLGGGRTEVDDVCEVRDSEEPIGIRFGNQSASLGEVGVGEQVDSVERACPRRRKPHPVHEHNSRAMPAAQSVQGVGESGIAGVDDVGPESTDAPKDRWNLAQLFEVVAPSPRQPTQQPGIAIPREASADRTASTSTSCGRWLARSSIQCSMPRTV